MAGAVSFEDLMAMLELLHNTRKTGVMYLQRKLGGEIHYLGGEMTYAQHSGGKFEGHEALMELLEDFNADEVAQGEYEFWQCEIAPVNTIKMGHQSLMMEAARLMDEAAYRKAGRPEDTDNGRERAELEELASLQQRSKETNQPAPSTNQSSLPSSDIENLELFRAAAPAPEPAPAPAPISPLPISGDVRYVDAAFWGEIRHVITDLVGPAAQTLINRVTSQMGIRAGGRDAALPVRQIDEFIRSITSKMPESSRSAVKSRLEEIGRRHG